ncbi:helix-turn-helix domain-containing protein [Paraburkholderia mimosarum]|uniref:helix-turn-helix domain-containing protein n=1 Tax=Paraburkholderia mimosarum TaxID=312026 RepID=UPI0039C1EED0
MNIHRRIREKRLAMGLSMEAMAELVGVSAWQTVQQWEREDGGTAPKRERLAKVAKVLNTSPEYLLFGTPPGAPEVKHPVQEESTKRTLSVMTSTMADENWSVEIERASGSAFLFLVPDDSMAPRYLRGDFAIVEPQADIELEDDVLVGLNDGRVFLARLLSRRGPYKFGTYADPGGIYIEASNIAWTHYVSGFVSARNAKRI